MKTSRPFRGLLFGLSLCIVASHNSSATVRNWTNSLGGSWFDASGWSPNGVPGSSDIANVNAAGTYTVVITSAVTVSSLNLGNASGSQTLLVDNGVTLNVTGGGTVQPNGILAVTNGGLQGQFTVQPSGQLLFTGSAVKTLYSCTLLNQGTVTWDAGYLYTGSTPTTVVSNGGLWQITSDYYIQQVAGGPTPYWINSGILRKSAGTGSSQIDNFAFTNQPGGLVDVQSGTLQFNASATTNLLAGNFTTSAGATLDLNSGTYLDAAAVFSGAGVNEFTGTTLDLRTNILSGLLLAAGSVYVLPTFQAAGTITNLTLDGATLHGTNQVGPGVLTINSGGVDGQLTILPAGQLSFATTAVKTLYALTLVNQGTVNWANGYLYTGSTPTTVISNSGLWQITSDYYVQQVAGGPTPLWINSGILRKTAGAGTSQIDNFEFDNQPGGLVDVQSGTLQFNSTTLTNLLAGNYTTSAGATLDLNSGTYLDAGAVFSGAGVNEFTGTTLSLRTNILSGLLLASGSLNLTPTFQQAGTITNLTLDGVILHGTNQVGPGTLTINSGGVDGQLTVLTNGQLAFATAAVKTLYSLTLLNQGTVNWASGYLYSGGTPTTVISNGGLWQISSDYYLQQVSGGPTPLWLNSGILRKNGGTAFSQIDGCSFTNQPGGLVDVQSGALQFNGNTTNLLAGNFSAASGSTLDFNSGTFLDAGGVFSGAGINEFTGTTLNLRTNILSGLLLAGGGVYLMPTFQQAGSITNLTLDGATLHGTNQVGSGTLTVNSGGVDGQLTILPAGQLSFATTATKALYSLTLLNQGTVNWASGYLYAGGTPTTVISNGGLWQITSDFYMQQVAGGPTPQWMNPGTLRKSSGSGFSQILNFQFDNSPNGTVQVDSGTLQLPSGFTNNAGTLHLNGGTLTAVGSLAMNSGTLNGSGTVGANALNGGTISPGNSPGLINFNSGLNLGSNATLVIEGIGTIPGSQYDQLAVSGPIVLGNATLQVASLPSVSTGTTFFIVTNQTGSAVSGTFNGLPENSLITASGQPFRIHYAGMGNSVTLVRDVGAAAPNLVAGAYSGGAFHLSGIGSASAVYQIQASTNFLQWANIGAVTGDVSGNFIFSDTNATNFRYRFYRTTN